MGGTEEAGCSPPDWATGPYVFCIACWRRDRKVIFTGNNLPYHFSHHPSHPSLSLVQAQPLSRPDPAPLPSRTPPPPSDPPRRYRTFLCRHHQTERRKRSVVYSRRGGHLHRSRNLGRSLRCSKRSLRRNRWGESSYRRHHIRQLTTSTPLASGRKKRKRSQCGDVLVDALIETIQKFSDMYVMAGENTGRLANCFQYEADSVARRMQVFDEVKKVEGLTNAQRVRVGKLLVQNYDYTNYFFTLDDEFKLDFLLSLLE
ncbi:uncharacterized protein LOC112091785 [Morus notabilis]|uniref:uncharacterized protein LOC112091785 n=1 Tax=Morus notabilis TaxID=981085 RepID=UPI000CECFAB4|nr:uncharacterized protein LOC112091785 [Morus notabilis]